MRQSVFLALLVLLASRGFSLGPEIVGSSHAESGYDYRDIAVVVVANPIVDGMMWLNGDYSYQLLFSERDKLVNLVQTAAKKIDIAVANKTTIAFREEIGRFNTENGALVVVSFETDGYALSYAVVRITGDGNNDILLLNKKDTEDFASVLGSANRLVDDYQKQVALFR